MRTGGVGNWAPAAIPCFLALTIAFGAAPEGAMIHAGRDDLARNFMVYADMWTPALAAIATCLLLGQRLAALRFDWPSARYAWIGYGLPLLAAALTYPILWVTRLAPSNYAMFETAARKDLVLGGGASVVMFALVATVGVIRSCSSALGEEIGWRGLLVPALHERMGFAGVTLVSGLIWGAWHVPLMLALPGGPSPLGLLLFFIGIIFAAGIAAWLRLRSGSIWPAVLFHASHNAFLQAFFDPMTVTTGRASYFATEGGLGMVVAYASILAVLLRIGGVPVQTETGHDLPAAEISARRDEGGRRRFRST